MKKFNYKILKVMAFSVIALFMSSSVFAHVQESLQDTTAQDTTTQMNEEQQTMPQEQNQRTGEEIKSQHPDKGINYSETIDQSELPQEVNTSLDDLYPAHEIQEVYRGGDDSFKVKVKNENDEAVVYYDAEGKFLRAENLSGLQQEGALPQEQGQRTMESTNKPDSLGTSQDTTETYQQDAEMQEDRTDPQEQYQQTGDSSQGKDPDNGVDYTETVQESELPQQINSSLDELYPAHEIQEIHKGNDDSFKIKVKNKEDLAVVYYDSQGDFLRAQNLSGLQQEGELPQEQSQKVQEQDDAFQNQQGVTGTQHDHSGSESEKDDMEPQEGQWKTEESDTRQNQTDPQEMNQRIEDVEESQDADRWGTDQRTPENERGQDAGQHSLETQQEIEGTQDEEKLEDNWGSEDMGAHQSTWKDEKGYPQEQNQQASSDDELKDDQSTWMGGEGTDTTSTPSRIDTTAVYKNQWEEGTFEEGDDKASPQEQNQQTDEWGKTDTTDTQGDYETTPVDTATTYSNQMMEDNTLDEEETASPQEQSQATGDADVDFSEEIQESELPESITTSLEELYPDYEIEEAYRGDDDSYKVEIQKNEEKVAVYYDSDGLFYRDEVLDDILEDTNKDTNQDW